MVYDPSPYVGTRIPAILSGMERDKAWLARKMGVSLSLVSRVVAGERSISGSFVRRACAALSLPAEVIFVLPPDMLASTDNMSERTEREAAAS